MKKTNARQKENISKQEIGQGRVRIEKNEREKRGRRERRGWRQQKEGGQKKEQKLKISLEKELGGKRKIVKRNGREIRQKRKVTLERRETESKEGNKT